MKLRIFAGLAAAVLVMAGVLSGGPADAAAAPYPVSYNFLQNTFTTNTAASAPGENIWSCRPTARHPRPVILVHGTGGNAATNWATYAALLANHGYCVFALTYGVSPTLSASPVAIGGMGRIEDSAQELKDFVAKVLRRTGATRVDLVGHSQGTLMPDYYVKFLGGARFVDHYVSLAPVWHGEGVSALGQLMSAGAAYGFDAAKTVPVCAACPEMVNGSPFMQQMRSGRYGVAVPGVKYTNIYTRYDDVVIPYTSGIEPGHPNMTNILLQSRCANDFSDHLEIASSPNAAQIVLNTLDPAHAQPLRCRLTLPVNGFVH
ncbi:esterase/lipase family protein [Nocardioides terrisoli]|uniref:esterase/lipase family protein n=1 Tax=Nocardioides terrisoli TaxID=3388267 RepID=UPI00287BB365|nr:alpha/beta fold hydrolase [Nocardioides marmorisolisilvae]